MDWVLQDKFRRTRREAKRMDAANPASGTVARVQCNTIRFFFKKNWREALLVRQQNSHLHLIYARRRSSSGLGKVNPVHPSITSKQLPTQRRRELLPSPEALISHMVCHESH